MTVTNDEDWAVRDAFDLSYRVVPPQEQQMFRLLGLVPGIDFDAGAAAAIMDVAQPEAAVALERLAGAHLIEECSPDPAFGLNRPPRRQYG